MDVWRIEKRTNNDKKAAIIKENEKIIWKEYLKELLNKKINLSYNYKELVERGAIELNIFQMDFKLSIFTIEGFI